MSAAPSMTYVCETAEPKDAQFEFQAGLTKPIEKAAQSLVGGTLRVPSRRLAYFDNWSNFGTPLPVSLAFYRRRTEHLLRKYSVMSMQVGRCPSVLGNFVFRGKASNVRMTTFEDALIFTMDMANCLKSLSFQHQQLLLRIALQEYTQGETAGLMGMCLRSVVTKYGEALDQLTEILMETDLLPLPEGIQCQDPKEYEE